MHPGQSAAFASQGDQPLVLENLHDQSGVLTVVCHQGFGIFPVETSDFRRGIGNGFVDEFSSAEYGVSHCAQSIIGKPQGIAYQGNAVHHHAATNLGPALACKARIPLKLDVSRQPSDASLPVGNAQCLKTLAQDSQVEIHHVPTEEYIGVEFANARGQGDQEVGFLAIDFGAGHRSLGDQVHLFDAAPHQGRGVDRTGVGRGFKIQRKVTESDFGFAGNEIGVDKANEPRPGPAIAASAFAYDGPLDSNGVAQRMVHQVAVGKAQIGFVARNAHPGETISQVPNFARQADCDAADGIAGQGAQFRPANRNTGFVLQVMAIALAHEEIGAEAIVLHQKGSTRFEASVELYNGAPVSDAVGGLEDYAVVHCFSPSWEEVEGPMIGVGMRSASRSALDSSRAKA